MKFKKIEFDLSVKDNYVTDFVKVEIVRVVANKADEKDLIPDECDSCKGKGTVEISQMVCPVCEGDKNVLKSDMVNR